MKNLTPRGSSLEEIPSIEACPKYDFKGYYNPKQSANYYKERAKFDFILQNGPHS